MKNRWLYIAVSALMMLGLAAGSAQAVPIGAGSISMSGGFTPTGGTGIGDATGIDFDPGGLGGAFTVSGVSGSLAGLAATGSVGTITDFTFAPLGGTISGFYTVDAVSFDLESISVVFQSSAFLVLSGTGTVNSAGFDSTPGDWAFSGNGSVGTFSWSASSSATATPAPEPASLLLLGSGVVGLGLWRWRRQTKA